MNPTEVNKATIDTFLERLAGETDQAAHSVAFTDFLKAMGKFWRYSNANTILIMCARPDLPLVNSRKRWQGLGYQLKATEWKNGIGILCPQFRVVEDKETKEKKEVLTHFSTGFIFARDQVEAGPAAAPVELPWQAIVDDDAALYLTLLATCRRLKFSVTLRSDLGRGIEGYSEASGAIVLNALSSAGNRVHTLVHEIAHSVCHPAALRTKFTLQEIETQAEAIAYVVLSSLGVAMPNSGTYLSLYGVTYEVIKRNTDQIHVGVKRILGAIEATMTDAATVVLTPVGVPAAVCVGMREVGT